MLPRHALTDAQWDRLRPVLPARRPGPKSKLGDRVFIDAVLYRAKTGGPWRDLPERFGPWNSVFDRFSTWASRGWWEDIFKALQLDVDESSCIVDGDEPQSRKQLGCRRQFAPLSPPPLHRHLDAHGHPHPHPPAADVLVRVLVTVGVAVEGVAACGP